MQDRVPVNPGRVLITPENGSAAYYATMTRADNPTQAGTPLNKASLLKDATAALFGLGADAVPDDVFAAVKPLIESANANANTKAQIATGSYTGTNKSGSSNKNSLTFDFEPKFVIIKPSYTDPSTQIPQFMGVWLRGMTVAPVVHGSTSGTSGNPVFSISGNTLSWYADSANYQLNTSGVTYRYIAIG